MPVQVSYPGVYIEEISSGVRTITGVATSITAFLGQAPQGPTTKAGRVLNYSDFVRQYGDLDVNYPMGFAVRDFFLNGGTNAVIARLYKAPSDTTKNPAAGLQIGEATKVGLLANSPGTWGNALLARVDDKVDQEVADDLGVDKADLFNLRVRLGPTGPLETFLNLTVEDTARRIDRVLAAESALVVLDSATPLPATVPEKTPDPTDPNKSEWLDAKTKRVATEAEKGHDSDPLDKAAYEGNRNLRTGKYLLEDIDLFNMVCVFGKKASSLTDAVVYKDILSYCIERRAFLLVDPPTDWSHNGLMTNPATELAKLDIVGKPARNAAVFYPRLLQANPLRNNIIEPFAGSGALAGVLARTDAERGVWKAAAGIDASLNGVVGLADVLTDAENGVLNQEGINVVRQFPVHGRVVWGARTLRGADRTGDEYKYVPVRRTALFLEESLYRGLQWVVFEPNDEPLWAQIRLNVGAFMQSLFRQGAFQGKTPTEAYFVKCDKETTTQDDINKGIVHIVVGFAPLKPAEFVIVQLQQIAGQLAA
ncbi:phage tail sheath C-terminal domain-containing protein [Nocardia altamirensis]|uniref:phage tail sheath C-terminal domain-containing protein n=1 Tax=Nocardia altamirensis TaxID=472158 RepID=UPI00084006EA|nr:phage tail sheath C-terminal domain-containing protein [Nocardia altamirensis]